MTRDEFLARRRAAAEQQDEETTAQRPAVSSAASTGMTREEFLERRRAGMEAAEQQTSTSVSRPTSVSPDTDSTLRRLAAAKEQNRKTTRAEMEETRTGSGRQLPGASGKLGDMLLDATRYQQAHKTGPSGEDALAYGVMSGTGAASLAALAGRALTGERADWYNDYQREAAEAAKAHPAAYGIGNVGGSLGIAYATGGLAGAATGALLTGEGAATAAGTVIKGLARNAMTFAMTDAIHNAGAFAADSMSDRDFINSMGVGMAQGAAGGLAAGLVSSGMANVLRKHNMMTPFMEFVRQTAAGTASAGANIATSYALRENKPTKEQMAQQFATAFLLSALQGAISTYETVQANKDQLEQYTAQMVKTWQQMAAQGQAAGMDRTEAGQQAFADQIRDLSTQIRFTLGRTYMAGQQQYVNNLYSLLDTLDDMIDTSMAQNAEWVYDTPVSPYNDAMLGSGEDIVPQLTEAITAGMTEGANQPPTPPVTPEAPVDTTIAAAGAQTPAPPEVSPETEEALRALTEQPDVPAAPETPQEPDIETPEEVIPPEPEMPAAPEPEPEPEPAAEPETVSPAETLRQNAEAGGLGKKGQQAIGDFYSGGMDPEQLTQYYAGFSAYYKAGGDGVPAERVRTPFADVLSEQAKIGAWSSGRADALAEGRTIPEPEPMPAAPETAVAQTEPSGYNEITEQPKPETVQPEPMTTAETAKPTVEQAKADLKRAIQVPVQTGNLEALREAIKSGELSPDVVTMGSKVPGFTREQQESLARQIIEGQQDGKEVIHADVPGDGRFDINTSDQDAVPKVLNALHVKVNQEAVITKDIDSWLKRSGKSGRSYVGRADDQYFLSDGYAAVRVPKTTADYALKEPAYKARMEDFRAQLNAAKVASGTLEEPRRGKMTVKGQATQVYAFRTADGVLAFPKDAFNKIDGGTLSYGPMGRGFIAVSRGEDGEVRAFALALDPKTFRQEDYNGFAPVKIKATLAADTSTDNSLPAAGAQGATREKEADNGGQGQSEAGSHVRTSAGIHGGTEELDTGTEGAIQKRVPERRNDAVPHLDERENGTEIAAIFREAGVEPAAGSPAALIRERAKGSFGLETVVVPDNVWRQYVTTPVNPYHPEDGISMAVSHGGTIYVNESISEGDARYIVEHEGPHAMAQEGFKPYLDHVRRTEEYINFTANNKRSLVDVQKVLYSVWQHIGQRGEFDLDSLERLVNSTETERADTKSVFSRFFDELNATLYGYIANGKIRSDENEDPLDLRNVLQDIDQYKADMDAIVAQFKAERTGGQGNGGVQGRTEEVGKGRRVSGGGGPGRPGSGAAETVPEAGRGLQGSGDRGPERVPENERLAGPAPGSGLHAGEGLLPGGDDRRAETEAGRAVPEQGAGEGRSGVGSAPSPDRGGRSGGPAVKQKRRTALNKNNYRITEDIDSSRPNFSDNYKAIQLIKTLEKESRPATAEERGVLARYKGWGGLKDAVLNANSYQATQLKRLLTPEEFSAARDSVLNAHYTSTKVISAIYDGVQRLGFDGGRVLEPSMGVGNFFGVMPEKLTKRSELYGVELDSITGKIAQNLYPDAKIDVAGFQDVLYPDNTFDLVIGNVPFSNQIHIPYRGSTYNLHDFFFVKALDETRPGGMVALITSTGTLDKISGKTQSEIAKRANLIAAFRLPDDAFRVNAGTSVTTDLIFLQKKGPGDESNGIEFGKIGKIDGIPINEYYVEHPKNVLGELAFEKGMYAGERTVVHATPGVNFQERLAAAMRTLPRNVMKEGAENKAPVRAKKRGERKRTTFVMTEDGAQITDKDTGEVIRYEEGTKAQKEKVDTIRDYIKVKTAFDGLVNAERSGNLEAAEDFRKKLNREYDDFAEKHGPILFNKRLLAADDDFVRMTGLELQSKEGVSKSAIFTRPTISKAKRTSAGSSDEALSIVLNEEGRVDVPRMAALTGRTEQQVLEDLEGEIIFTPDGDYVLTAQYASGNIYEKLAAIEDREGFEEQRKVLEAALPKKKGVGEIRASLGAHWIAPKYVREFLQETFNPQYGSIDVQYSRELGKWQVNHFWTTSKKYSTDSMEAWKVAEGTLNGKNLTVYDKDADGRRITNRDETAAVQQKQADLRNAFEEWVFRDKERADDLIDTYNRTFNAVAPMDYVDLGQRIDFGLGPDAKKQPRDYQKTAVARIVFGGNTLLHHGVGTGKTLDMILAAHVMKQNGTAQKPLFVVPNGKVNDFRNEILEVYPDASILALDNETMSPKQLQRTKAQIATGDWDYVLVYRSAFERLAVSPETEARFLQQQLDMFEEAIRDSAGERNGTNRFEKSLIGRKKTLEERIKKTLAKPKDETTYFEDMGIDALFVDEAHNFKKVGFPTSFEISGIDSSSNQITTDLYMKENYLRDRGGKIVLATATPITNTLSEMYNMALHVAPEVYESAGIYTFDTWLNTFGQIESQPEIAPDGKTWRMKERVRGFRNGNEMVGLYRQFADVVQTKDVVKGLPEAEFIDVVSPATELNQKLLDSFADRATRAGRRGDKGDNMLQITNDGRAAGTDLRLLTGVIGEMFPDMKKSELDVPTSKLNKCVQLVAQEYKDSADIKGTQFIFLDLGVNDGGKRYSFNLYKDLIAKLEKAGIPRSEIANIQDYDGEDRRSELYDKMNSGELRVLIGSTAKMGEGVNAQERAVALHHLNVPYRPDNLEQREGRIIRFGNINKKVRIYRYIQEKSFDSYMWQMIERKAAYTAQALAGGDAADLEEVGDIELKAREAKGIATGNPLIVEKMKLQDQAEKLRAIYRNWQGERYSAARNAERYREEIPRLERAIEKIKQDIRTVEKNRGDEFRITIGGKTYDSRKDAIKPLNAMLKHANIGKTIGSINGLDIVLHEPYLRDDGDYAFTLRGAYEYSGSFGNSEDGNLTRVTNKGTKGPEDELKRAEADLAYDRRALKDAEEMQKGAFPQQEELDRVTARQLEVDRELGITENEEAVELGQDEYLLETEDDAPIGQEVSSAGTSIKQVPALFNNKNVVWGKVNIDIGGGRFDLATDFLKERGVFNLVFDPYNRPEKQNSDTLEFLQKGNKADTATCANVLNVIAESDARANVILEMAKAIKPDGRAYFMVYEGDGSGEGRKTSAGWQNNRKTASYEDEIRQYFGEVVRKGKLIIATQPRRNLPKAAWEIQPGKAVRYSREVGSGMPHPERWTAERVGDREKQAKSLSEIMEQIRHDFGINITKGHIRGRGVMGQYDDSNRGMRIRSANDLPTSVHELGHHLDNVYKFSEDLTAAEKKELLDQLPDELKARYKAKDLPGEGVAEFVRRFMTNRTTAALDYPEFTKEFLNTMNGHDRALVEQLADEVNAALALDVDTATSSIRLREDGRPDARTRKEKIKDVLERFYQAHNDSNYGIKRFDNALGSNVYTLASNAAYADAIAGQICTGSVMTDINSNVVGLGLAAVFDGVNLDDTNEYIALGELLLVKHAPERIAEGMRIFADDRKNSEAFCKRRETEILKQYPNLAPVPDRLYEFQKNLLQTWGVDLGLVSEESAEQWAERWPQYVPLNRAVPVESRGFGGRRTFANQKNPFKKAVGSGLDIIHPVDSIIDHIITLVNSGVRNNVALALADAARDTPANAQLIEKIPTPMIPHKIGLKGVKQGIEDTAEMLLEKELIGDQAFLGIEAILHSMQDFMMQYTRQQPHGNIITVMRDGRPEYWKVNDPLLLRSLADMSPSRTRGVLDAYGRISRFITGNITGMNVLWSIFSNGPRDLGSFFAYAAEKNPLKVFPAIASAYANYANLLRGKEVDPLYTEYLGMGGGSFSVYAADRDVAKSVREKLRRMTSDNAMKRIGWNPLDWIEYISNVVEQGPRFAIYKLLRLRGMTTQEAFYAATDVTVNFRRGGWIARDLNKVIPFYNAGVQGFDKFVRYFGAFDVPPGGPPKGPGLTGGDAGDGGNGPGGSGSGGSMPRDERSRVRRSRMMWYLIASAIAAAVSFAINHLTKDREEDYKRLSNWTKNNYFLVPIGDGRYFAISKPREVGVLSSFMESAAERVLMDDRHAMDGFYEYVTDVMLPGGVAEIAQGDWASAVGSMGLFGIAAYQMANRDFLGRPIVSSGLTRLEPRDQYNDRTSKLAYYMGQAFNISPQRADFFFEQVLGGWWKYQKAVFPVSSENRDLTLGVYNQYIKDSQYSTDLLNRMYDRTEASEMAKNSDPDDMDKAIWYKMDNNLSTFYGRFYKLSKEDSRSEQARAARKAVLEMINEYEITRESGQDPTPFESVWGEVFDAVRETGKTELLPKVLNPLIKSEKGYGTDLNAQQYLEYQTKYNDLYADIVADALQNARNDSEKYALIAKANEVAQERAQDYMLKRLGVPETSAIEAKYGDVSDADIATFQALLYLAGQDGGLRQTEVIEALDRMRTQGLSREDASFLFETRYKPKNNPYK